MMRRAFAAMMLVAALPAVAADSDASVTVSAGEKGFGFRSGDGAFEFRIKGLLQADLRVLMDDQQAFKDTFLMRRMEPSFELLVGNFAFFKLQPQFAGDAATTSDIYGELRFDPAAALRVGKFKAPFGLENLQAAAALAFLERGLPTELGAGRDVGVQVHGERAGLGYAVAWLNGSPDGRDAVASDTDDHKELAARLFYEPVRNAGLGIAVSTGRKAGQTTSTAGVSASTATATFNNTLPRYRSAGQNTIFSYRSATTPTDADTVIADGTHMRWSPQFYFYTASFGLLGEYAVSSQEVALNGVREEFENTAWQLVASYVLTGEPASYRGVKPAAPYVPGGGGRGALELALRFGAADFDDGAFTAGFADPAGSVTEATTTGLALSWYASANVRLALNYDRTAFDGGAAAGDRRDETAVFSRVQISF